MGLSKNSFRLLIFILVLREIANYIENVNVKMIIIIVYLIIIIFIALYDEIHKSKKFKKVPQSF